MRVIIFFCATIWTAWSQEERRQLRTKPRNPYQDFVSPDETGMVQGTDEFVYFFRKAGKRLTVSDTTVLEISEIRLFFHPGWQNHCGDWCGEYDEDVEDGISTLEGCCAVHALFIGSACGGAIREDEDEAKGWAEEDAAKAKVCFVFTTKEEYVTEHYITKHVRKDEKSVHMVIAGGMLDAVGMVVAARSAVDASADFRLLKLYIILDASDEEAAMLHTSLRCALGEDVYFRIAQINEEFLERRSTTFQKLFAVKINKTRTRKTLIKAPANYARMYIPDLFEELRDQLVIYLDSDVLITADLQRLRHEATDSLAAAAASSKGRRPPAVAGTRKSPSHREYELVWLNRYPDNPRNISVFNSGVMVIDFYQWDGQRLSQSAESWLQDNLVGGSQMPINLAIDSNYVEVDRSWNCPIRGTDVHASIKYVKPDLCMKNPRIRHWTGRFKPWLPKGHLRFFWLAHAYDIQECLRPLMNDLATLPPRDVADPNAPPN